MHNKCFAWCRVAKMVENRIFLRFGYLLDVCSYGRGQKTCLLTIHDKQNIPSTLFLLQLCTLTFCILMTMVKKFTLLAVLSVVSKIRLFMSTNSLTNWNDFVTLDFPVILSAKILNSFTSRPKIDNWSTVGLFGRL